LPRQLLLRSCHVGTVRRPPHRGNTTRPASRTDCPVWERLCQQARPPITTGPSAPPLGAVGETGRSWSDTAVATCVR
jgi:hypothetical protein